MCLSQVPVSALVSYGAAFPRAALSLSLCVPAILVFESQHFAKHLTLSLISLFFSDLC